MVSVSSHLLEQACDTFRKNILEITQKETINMRVISSNPEHSDAAKIEITCDILIMTTQTATIYFTKQNFIDVVLYKVIFNNSKIFRKLI